MTEHPTPYHGHRRSSPQAVSSPTHPTIHTIATTIITIVPKTLHHHHYCICRGHTTVNITTYPRSLDRRATCRSLYRRTTCAEPSSSPRAAPSCQFRWVLRPPSESWNPNRCGRATSVDPPLLLVRAFPLRTCRRRSATAPENALPGRRHPPCRSGLVALFLRTAVPPTYPLVPGAPKSPFFP
ncbi:proline-rich receptor-like protein kinase PERK9 [Iris pallida]|uniref:Proline-rich receptor-like protein kinase PERK9 n=1 Tax=Iris pallida TaxID=29817 RepID=A0AAX6I604_IRIPA|nr:proline-rich receptor-like protein kinase PERK9 [Iris pallida]